MISTRNQFWSPANRTEGELVLGKPGKHRTYPNNEPESTNLKHFRESQLHLPRRGTASNPLEGNNDTGRMLLHIALSNTNTGTRSIGTQTEPSVNTYTCHEFLYAAGVGYNHAQVYNSDA